MEGFRVRDVPAGHPLPVDRDLFNPAIAHIPHKISEPHGFRLGSKMGRNFQP